MAFPQVTKKDLELIEATIEAEYKGRLWGGLIGFLAGAFLASAGYICFAAWWPLVRAAICAGAP